MNEWKDGRAQKRVSECRWSDANQLCSLKDSSLYPKPRILLCVQIEIKQLL